LTNKKDKSKNRKPTKNLEDWDKLYDWQRFAKDSKDIMDGVKSGADVKHDFGVCHEYKK